MANPRIVDRNIRKITKVGRASLAVTIPVEMIAKLGWREKQKVRLSLKGHQVVIRDWKA
ncbi:MAG: AbrB/MazE/SpoVT family DNA-binding domain-containing protein [Candidatus Saccharibacteria bacterium]